MLGVAVLEVAALEVVAVGVLAAIWFVIAVGSVIGF